MMGRIPAACAAALLLALGFGTMATAPAAAQDAYGAYQDTPESTSQGIPWYMPQPWAYPKNTAPLIQRRPGEYGYARRSGQAYGGFSNYCYGDCGIRPGTVATGGGVVLFEPAIVSFDQRAYQVVPRPVAVPQPAVAVQPPRAQRPTSELVIRLSSAQRAVETGQPTFTMENGVRIIRPQRVD